MKQIVIDVSGEELTHYEKAAKLHSLTVEEFTHKLLRERTAYIERGTLRRVPTDISARTAALLIKRDEPAENEE